MKIAPLDWETPIEIASDNVICAGLTGKPGAIGSTTGAAGAIKTGFIIASCAEDVCANDIIAVHDITAIIDFLKIFVCVIV